MSQPLSGIYVLTLSDGSTRTVDRRAKLSRYAEKFRQAKDWQNSPAHYNPKANNNGLSLRPTLLDMPRHPRELASEPGKSAELPRAAYGTQKAPTAKTHGAKHTTIRYREDWNADGSGWSEVHDLVAGDYNRDADQNAGILRTMGFSRTAKKLATRQETIQESLERLQQVLVEPPTSGKPWTPTTTRRELTQRLSHKQRRILHAYKLWLSGSTWREVAKKMNEPEHVVYDWYRTIRSMLGRAATTRDRGPKDQNGRFVGYVAIRKNGSKTA
jgi:hypothetical protein